MAAPRTVPLLEVEPELARDLSAEELQVARGLQLPAVTLDPGPVEVGGLLEERGAFAALLLDGLLLQSVCVSGRIGARLLGSGDLLGQTGEPSTALIAGGSCRAVTSTRAALLGQQMLAALRRWPALLPPLWARITGQSERLLAQLIICQLPRVEDRLLAMLWLLAESWGHVTAAGTLLPWTLTHELLGGLVGARRSTVTLALRTLIEQGALVRQDRGWLLLAPPPRQPTADTQALPSFEPPRLFAERPSPWREADVRGEEEELGPARLRELIPRLREHHLRQVAEVRLRIAQSAQVRRQAHAIQQRINQERANRSLRPAPSAESRR